MSLSGGGDVERAVDTAAVWVFRMHITAAYKDWEGFPPAKDMKTVWVTCNLKRKMSDFMMGKNAQEGC